MQFRTFISVLMSVALLSACWTSGGPNPLLSGPKEQPLSSGIYGDASGSPQGRVRITAMSDGSYNQEAWDDTAGMWEQPVRVIVNKLDKGLYVYAAANTSASGWNYGVVRLSGGSFTEFTPDCSNDQDLATRHGAVVLGDECRFMSEATLLTALRAWWATSPGSFSSPRTLISSRPVNQASELQPNPPNSLSQRVWVQGRNAYIDTRPYWVYRIDEASGDYKLGDYYVPYSLPARSDGGALFPYAGDIHDPTRGNPKTSKFGMQFLIALSGPGLSYWQPKFSASNVANAVNPIIDSIDGYQFRSFADFQNYLASQPGGRVVEVIFHVGTVYDSGRTERRYYTMHVPLLRTSKELETAWWNASNSATKTGAAITSAMNREPVNPLLALFAIGLGVAATAAINAPPSDPFEDMKRATQACRDAGGIC
ncbi:MAG TPA: hypothetical protein P5341_10660 [Hyphomonas sp.]|nr:hypothetical protein [Hyphomonas sp.]